MKYSRRAVHFPPVSLFLWKNIPSFVFSKLYIFFKRYTLKTIPVSFCLLWMAIFHFLSFHRDTFSRKSIQKAFHWVPSTLAAPYRVTDGCGLCRAHVTSGNVGEALPAAETAEPELGQAHRSASSGRCSEVCLAQRSNFHKGALPPAGKIG
ncbi:hypothetical protein [Faecalibacterium sp. An77]|uniref:hypothetical protein n=1 Tax=Faecalibacterium sp. An77 TaxID=1965655 RepID=UPI0011849C7D|nr:hypothetical protein [Faecalibacterium sp. An77]